MVLAVDDAVAALLGEEIRPGFEPVIVDRVGIIDDKIADKLARIAGNADGPVHDQTPMQSR